MPRVPQTGLIKVGRKGGLSLFYLVSFETGEVKELKDHPSIQELNVSFLRKSYFITFQILGIVC